MQLTKLRTGLRAVLIACLVLAACEMNAASTNPTFVEVRIGGHDGLTLKLREALEDAFVSSQDFHLSVGNEPTELVVLIPTGVGWKETNGRVKVFYTVEFQSPDRRKISATKGSCWSDALVKCTTHIVKDAKVAARKIH